MDYIKKNLNNYLQSIEQNLKFGPYPLTGKNCEEIGIVIGLNQSNKNSIEPLEININNFTKIIFNSAYIVKKGIINKLNEIYSTNEVIKYLNNNQQLNGINYNNLNNNYVNISNYLNQNQKNYISEIKQIESEKINYFDQNNNSPIISKLNNNSNLIYIDDFELIDEEFAQYLFKMFNHSLTFYKVDYAKINNKIFLIIYLNQNTIYEIIEINNNNITRVLYLIEIKKNNIINNTYELSNYIGNVLLNNEINKLISYGNVINIGNNLSINLYAINNEI